jgi:transcriptional regulator with XRE-family HTH domain
MNHREFRAIREEAKLSQQKLGDLIGRTGRQIRDYESGNAEIPPYVDLLMRYFDRFGLPDQAFRYG